MRARSLGPVRLAVTAVAVVAATVVAPTSGVAAVPGADDGRWYVEATGLTEIHQRTTGAGITIAVLDEAVNPAAADLVGADVQPHEPSYCAATEGGEAYPATSTEALAKHTTSIATMLVGTDAGTGGAPGIPGVAPGATVRTYEIRYGDQPCETPAGQEREQDDAIRDAVADGADIIAVPGAGRFTTDGVADALRAGVIVVAAGGNDGALTGMPAIANGVVTVGTVTSDVTLAEGSPVGPNLAAVAPGARIRAMQADWSTYGTTTGSSNATAYTAGALALLWSLYPDATDRQIIQALIHTTDAEVKETPTQDMTWGYGTVSPRGLLSVDPTDYPDENPLLLDDGTVPTVADVLGTDQTATAPAEAPGDSTADDDGAAVPEAPADAGLPIGVLVGAAAALLLIAGAVLAVIISRRRTPTTDHDATHTTARGSHG